ncbi:MAG: hypothetical protein EBY32_03390 [Proteobacteria bacterium]|nr:hypothetical protein [Pseudomonadota bacterium]
MKNPVSILSFGISCPGGTSPQALEDFSKWPVESIADAGGRGLHEVSRINLSSEPVNRWRMKPRLRRASPLSHHLIEAIAQTLEARPDIDPARVGVVGAFFLGCLEYSVRFYKGLSNDGRRFASPILFPETVVNTPLSHVVAELGIGGPVYSQVGDTSCWVSALRTACLWIENGDTDHVIVAGAEEFEPHLLDAFHSLRWFRAGHLFRIAEGHAHRGWLHLPHPRPSSDCRRRMSQRVRHERPCNGHSHQLGISNSSFPLRQPATRQSQPRPAARWLHGIFRLEHHPRRAAASIPTLGCPTLGPIAKHRRCGDFTRCKYLTT